MGDDTLGEKHKAYNKAVRDAIVNKKPVDETHFTPIEHDLDNLMKIDIASTNKDVDYILSVLKSADMLYVSRALKQTWLVEDQYENIINPQYLRQHLYPEMTTKAGIKLQKYIRQHLKTENRVEQFYSNETNPAIAAKWLSRCSIPFIEKNVTKHMIDLEDLEFKRICERSVTIFEAATKKSISRSKMAAASFLLHSHVNKYLDVMECINKYNRPNLSVKATNLIMKQTPDRVMNKFFVYVNCIHIPTFVKYLKGNEIKDFLFKLVHTDKEQEHDYTEISRYEVMKHFIKRMPKADQYEFVKIFLSKENTEVLNPGTEMYARSIWCKRVLCMNSTYVWYEFAPFEIAFTEIKKFIESDTSTSYEKTLMLNVLLKCADTDKEHLKTLLIYYKKIYLKGNDDTSFLDSFVAKTNIYKYEDDIWNLFNEIMNTLKVFNEEENNGDFVDIIIMQHILHNQVVPSVIEEKNTLSTLKKYRKQLNEEQQHKVFEYLFKYVINKIEKHYVLDENTFKIARELLGQLIDLLIDWDKDIAKFPIVLDKLRDLIKIRKANSWNMELESLYNKNKTWRKHMFEESIILNPSQDVLVNALKHDPNLLVRYEEKVESMRNDDKICLKQLLKKIRIYWPTSIADCWTNSYLARCDKLEGRKAFTRGLFTLLPQRPVLDIIQKYAPKEAKINWSNTDELTLGLQRCIAKYMHITRPQPPADAILSYAKGDFLQFALPSVLSIFYNMNRIDSQEQIPKLLNSPVSLQKHGLRFAFIKMEHEDLKSHLTDVWKTSKNVTIRAITFKLMFQLLCKEKDDNKANEFWDILEVFIENLTYVEDKTIYEMLSKVETIPSIVRPKMLIKSYRFLKALLPYAKDEIRNYEYNISKLASYTREVMEFISPEFVVEIITEYLNDNFYNKDFINRNDDMLQVISSYVLHAKGVEAQNAKYENVLAPIIKRSLELWDQKNSDDSYFIRSRLKDLLRCLFSDLNNYVIKNKVVIPTKLFTYIQNQLDKSLIIQENYVMLRVWQFTVKITELVDKSVERENWHKICADIAPECAKIFLNVLKNDVEQYFLGIYVLFSKVLAMTTSEMPKVVRLKIYEEMLSDQEFIHAYLSVLKQFQVRYNYYTSEDKCEEQVSDIRRIIRAHPSVEVKMHYYNVFKTENNNDRVFII